MTMVWLLGRNLFGADVELKSKSPILTAIGHIISLAARFDIQSLSFPLIFSESTPQNPMNHVEMVLKSTKGHLMLTHQSHGRHGTGNQMSADVGEAGGGLGGCLTFVAENAIVYSKLFRTVYMTL